MVHWATLPKIGSIHSMTSCIVLGHGVLKRMFERFGIWSRYIVDKLGYQNFLFILDVRRLRYFSGYVCLFHSFFVMIFSNIGDYIIYPDHYLLWLVSNTVNWCPYHSFSWEPSSIASADKCYCYKSSSCHWELMDVHNDTSSRKQLMVTQFFSHNEGLFDDKQY